MAATSVLRLKVDDKEYNASLRQAQQGMQHLEQALQTAGKTFSQVDKSVVEYARAIGQMETQSKTARGKIGEMTSAFVELSTQYNKMSADMKNTDVGRALAQSMDELRQRTVAAKQELQQLNAQLAETKVPDMDASGSSLLSGLGGKFSGAMQVFAGNMMTKAAGAIANLGSEMLESIHQGVELAKQGEGIRIAFERLGRGDILDGLRQATHGTVTDIELMKAAVKFNDFKLPLDELGTMLAFAQQKAKDTGQSVDYMVDSIVTGLGRKSLMILDNLGLSATEVKDKIAETGDMTKAVGAIIREQMAKAGDYVETAADRAAQANVSLQNKMEELGRKFAPVEEASNQLWTSMKISILDVVGGPLARLLNGLTEAGRLKNMLDDLNGGGNGKESQTEKALRILREYSGGSRGIEGKRDLYNRQVASYNKQEEKAWREANRLREELKGLRRQQKENGLAGNLQPLISETSRQLEAAENRAKAFQIMRANYQKGAAGILNPVTTNTPATTISTNKPTAGKGGKGGKTITEEKDDFVEINGLINMAAERVSDLQRRIREAPSESMITELRDQLKDAQAELDRLNGKEVKIQMETGTSIQNDAGMSGYIASIKQQLETADYGTSLYNGLSAQLADMTTIQNLVGESLKAGLGTAMFDAADATGKDFWTRAMEGGVDNIDWQTIADKINEARKAAGLDAIVINFKTGDVKSQAKEMSKDWKDAASAIQSVGSAMSQIEDPAAKIVGTIGQAIATMALSYAEASHQAAMNPANAGWGWIAFAATGLATMISSIAAIHSATGYAEGGVIKGNSYSGDNIGGLVDGSQLVGLNAGEIVLNASQQNTLAQNLQGSGGSARLSATVSGEQIVLAVNRYLRRSGQGELVTWK